MLATPPRECGLCGRVYLRPDVDRLSLDFVGAMRLDDEDEDTIFDYRQCDGPGCKNTLTFAVRLPPMEPRVVPLRLAPPSPRDETHSLLVGAIDALGHFTAALAAIFYEQSKACEERAELLGRIARERAIVVTPEIRARAQAWRDRTLAIAARPSPRRRDSRYESGTRPTEKEPLE